MSKSTKQPSPHVSLTVNGARAAGRMSRRETIQWLMGVVAASAVPAMSGCQQAPKAAAPLDKSSGPAPENAPAPQEPAKAMDEPTAHFARTTEKGYGVDANLTKLYKPGDVWPLTFDGSQKKTAAALADTILPKDHLGPAASEVGVIEMMDEWISAPYPAQQADRPIILDGLKWLEEESNKRFKKGFADLNQKQKHSICDDICHSSTARKPFKTAAKFFTKFRSIAAGAYYATPEGWQAIGYVGNVALPSFDGPPTQVLQKLGVTQTVT